VASSQSRRLRTEHRGQEIARSAHSWPFGIAKWLPSDTNSSGVTLKLTTQGAGALHHRIGGVLSTSNILGMSARLDPSWSVLASPSTPAVDRCVDIFKRPDGTFGFEEFRRDSEDMGSWTPIAYFSAGSLQPRLT